MCAIILCMKSERVQRIYLLALQIKQMKQIKFKFKFVIYKQKQTTKYQYL